MKKRVEKLRLLMKEKEYPGFLVSRPENIYYLSGFTGSTALLFITQDEAFIVTDFRYIQQAEKEASYFQVFKIERDRLETLKDLASSVDSLAFESTHISHSAYLKYRDVFGEILLIPDENLIEDMRVIKDEEEIAMIKEAARRADRAFTHILPFIKAGVKERELALELEFFMKKEGASKLPFAIIVASGKRGSLPHGVASDKEIKKGELITMDFGSYFEGYCSDITRTVGLGPLSDRKKEIYGIVQEAQKKAREGIRAGLMGKEVDKISRDIIEGYSLGEYFGHGLGHGVGLMVHERPTLSKDKEEILKEGMLVTIEPGIYIPDWGGVRIEDMILVKEDKGQVLTQSNRELILL